MAIKLLSLAQSNPKIVGDSVASIAGLVCLYSPYDTAANNYSSFLDHTGAAYQVTATKTLYIVSVQIITDTALNSILQLGYADASCSNAAGAPAGLKAQLASVKVPTANVVMTIPGIFKIPAGKYPTWQAGVGRSTIAAFGFEE